MDERAGRAAAKEKELRVIGTAAIIGLGTGMKQLEHLILLTPALSIRSIAIYTTYLYCKYNKLQVERVPSPVGEGWGEENKNKHLYPPHPNLLPQGRRSWYLCRYLCIRRGSKLLKLFRTHSLAKTQGLIASARAVFEVLHRSDFRIAAAVINQVLVSVNE